MVLPIYLPPALRGLWWLLFWRLLCHHRHPLNWGSRIW